MYSPTEYLLLRRQPSRWLALALMLMGLLACVGVLQSALPLWPSLLCLLLVACYCSWVWPRQISLSHPHSVTGLRFDSDAKIKAVVPTVAIDIIDDAIQMHGASGISQDFPLASMYTAARTLRLADGPDEVHRMVVARRELKPYLG